MAKRTKRSEIKSFFKIFSLGVSTNRDSVVYDFSRETLKRRIEKFCDDYNGEVIRYKQKGKPSDIDAFVNYKKVQWSSTLKNYLKREIFAEYKDDRIRESLYRPFTKMLLYYDHILNDRPALFQNIFPTAAVEEENQVICVSQTGEKPFCCMITDKIPHLVMCGGFGAATQCFPFYVYEDANSKKENVSDWILELFQKKYNEDRISKRDIFYYVYAILHHPGYREKYSVNLSQELPRIPLCPDLWKFVEAGQKLAQKHIFYEKQPEYPLEWIENNEVTLNWRVERMKLSKDKGELFYNEFLKFKNIPRQVFDYRLGNRSALDWVIDQYQVRLDEQTGEITDPNRPDDPEYIARLIGKVVTVSIETMRIINNFPPLEQTLKGIPI